MLDPAAREPRTWPSPVRDAQFALAKFRPTTLPSTLVVRSALCDRLSEGAGVRLTVVIGSAGSGKSVLLSSWAQAREQGLTSWLSCDESDADPVRFWTAFVQSIRVVVPTFGATAADLLASGRVVFADVVASLANEARRLPTGFAVVVDDFHEADAAAARDMADLIALWPCDAAQLVLSSRSDPQVRLHRLRMARDLWELRDRDLRFSFHDCGLLISRFGVDLPLADLARLHQRSEGWAASMQMTALALQTCNTPAEVAHALDVRGQEVSEYFISEVLDEQSPDLASFMLETSVLSELTAASCGAVTARPDSGALLRSIDHAHLFLVPLDDERTRFRYHRLVRDVLYAELRRRDRARERLLQLRAATWFESSGDARRAARHFLVAREADRALALLQNRVVTDFLRDPTLPDPLELGLVDASLLENAPDHGLALALDLLFSGDVVRGGTLLDRVGRHAAAAEGGDTMTEIQLGLARTMQHLLSGRAEDAGKQARAVRALHDAEEVDEWSCALSLMLLRVYTVLQDYEAVEREARATLEQPGLSEPVMVVMLPGLRALALLDQGRLAEAAAAADGAELEARRLGVADHIITADHLRAQAGLALERRDFAEAERLTQEVLSISTGHSPVVEYQAALDRAAILLARGLVHEALASVDAAREILVEPGPALRTRAAELEAYARLALGDIHSAAELARTVPTAARSLLLARVALASGDPEAATEHLNEVSARDLGPRQALIHGLLLAATAIERSDPAVESVLAVALQAARRGGFCNTVVTTAPQVTNYLVEHATPLICDPYHEALVSAALEVRATARHFSQPGPVTVDQLTKAERRVLDLLPTHTYRQIAAALYVSPHTVKSHLRSVYRKLGAESRAQALQRAVDLRLL